MNTVVLFLGIILYFFLLITLYIFIIKRLKYLNDRHIYYTKVEGLHKIYISLKKRILILFCILFVVSTFIILKFLYVSGF